MKNRAGYVEKLYAQKDNNNISILTGMGKSGKSGIFILLIERLMNENVSEKNIIYINYEKYKEDNIKDSLKLYYFIQKLLIENGRKYLFLDDVDFVDRWERALKLLCSNNDLKIYVSASNKLIFNSELFQTGEYQFYSTEIFPLSFNEFLEFNNPEEIIEKNKLFEDYVRKGSLPKVHQHQFSDEDIPFINEGVYSSIVLKEVLLKNKVGDFFILNNVVEILAENLGENLSANKISSISTAKGNKSLNKINPASRTVESHIEMLKSAYLIHELVRYDILADRELKTLGKYYFNEIGFIECITSNKTAISNGIVENIVYLELLRNNYTVYNGKIKEKYITFVAVKGEDRKYIQVVVDINDVKSVKKLLSPLLDVSGKGDCEVIYVSNNLKNSKKYDKYEMQIKFISLYDYLA